MDERIKGIKEWKIGVNIQRCKQHDFYVANSPEYPCPYCQNGRLEIHIKELEEGIEKHRKYTKRYDITPEHIKDILGNHDEELYKLIKKEKP